jgi:prophage regulatory protein
MPRILPQVYYFPSKSKLGERGLHMTHTIQRLPEVKKLIKLSRSTIYSYVAAGKFPKPIRLGGRAVGWIESEIQEWLRQRIEASRK